MRATAKTCTGAPDLFASSAARSTAAFGIGRPSVASSTPPRCAVAAARLIVRRRGMRGGRGAGGPAPRRIRLGAGARQSRRHRLHVLLVLDGLAVPVERQGWEAGGGPRGRGDGGGGGPRGGPGGGGGGGAGLRGPCRIG